MTPEEKDLITTIQNSLGNAKVAMRTAMQANRGLMDIQKTAGRDAAYVEAYASWAEFDGALNAIHKAHAKGSAALLRAFPTTAGPVILGGGGGR